MLLAVSPATAEKRRRAASPNSALPFIASQRKKIAPSGAVWCLGTGTRTRERKMDAKGVASRGYTTVVELGMLICMSYIFMAPCVITFQ